MGISIASGKYLKLKHEPGQKNATKKSGDSKMINCVSILPWYRFLIVV
jgi:hypothetical protein